MLTFSRPELPALVVQAPAKLNLFLEILGKRADGYHELETLMITVGIYDTLSFTEEDSEEIGLRVVDAGRRSASLRAESELIPTGSENLVVRAALLLRQFAGLKRGVRIALWKRIPAAAGLAGGSSDAAATLVALNRLWKLGLATSELCSLAGQLGSDVAFFVTGQSAAVCRGRGEIVEPMTLPFGMHFVVVRPHSGLSTAAVYRNFKPAATTKQAEGLVEAFQSGRLDRAGETLHNALEPTACELNPDVKRVKSELKKLPVLGELMSGSGTACFALCANQAAARQAAARLRAMGIGHAWEVTSRP